MKKCFLLAPLILLMACLCCGCGITNVEEGERKAVEYTVLKTDAIPPEVAEVIKAQGDAEFQMTYKSDGFLYILRGYGKQKSGGLQHSGRGSDGHRRGAACEDPAAGAGDEGGTEGGRI